MPNSGNPKVVAAEPYMRCNPEFVILSVVVTAATFCITQEHTTHCNTHMREERYTEKKKERESEREREKERRRGKERNRRARRDQKARGTKPNVRKPAHSVRQIVHGKGNALPRSLCLMPANRLVVTVMKNE